MLLKNKLLISIASFGVVSAAAGGVYYFQKDKKSVVIPTKLEPEIQSKNSETPISQKELDPCEEHAKTHPRPANFSSYSLEEYWKNS